jgi:hypothetical protein
VVEHPDVHQRQRVAQPLRDQSVRLAGFGDAGRVVVGEDHRRGIAGEGLPDTFARVDAGTINGAAEHVFEGDQRTGSFDQVGLRVTKSLLFAGEGSGLYRAGGGKFYAYDKATGAIISEMTRPAIQSGVPMTYAIYGRQYIVVASANDHPGELVALTVP